MLQYIDQTRNTG